MKKGSILLIDDEEVTLKLLSVMLKSMGYNVLAAQESVQGFEAAVHERPDLIILDGFMPVLNGWDLLHVLRTREETKNIPVVMLTSADQVKNVELAFDLGAKGYLTKPVNPALFSKKITEVLNSSVNPH